MKLCILFFYVSIKDLRKKDLCLKYIDFVKEVYLQDYLY